MDIYTGETQTTTNDDEIVGRSREIRISETSGKGSWVS